jgi:hypothetical protein
VWPITELLRNPTSGRLDAVRIARLYREPLSRYARVFGVTTVQLRRVPDRIEFQAYLSRFEQVARIMPLLKREASFALWVKAPNNALKGATPLDLLCGSRNAVKRLVDLVDEVLVGQPD